MGIKREWSPEYLQKQHEAIRWLAEQGVSSEEIRLMTWGRVDDTTRELMIKKKVVFFQYDRENNAVKRDEYEREFRVQLRGTKCEWYFLKSKYPCMWMFVKFVPTSWRKEKTLDSLYTLEEIEAICGKGLVNRDMSVLTNNGFFANIETSRLNITKMKTKELIDKAKTPT